MKFVPRRFRICDGPIKDSTFLFRWKSVREEMGKQNAGKPVTGDDICERAGKYALNM